MIFFWGKISKILIKKISHLGGTVTVQCKKLDSEEWSDINIRVGSDNIDINEFEKRINEWISEREIQRDEVIWVTNY